MYFKEKSMGTIIITLDSKEMKNPDLDIIYQLPDKVEKYTKGKVSDNGYDYLSNTLIGIWLKTDSARESYESVVELMKKKKFCGNDLSKTAKVYISDKETAELEECEKVYPVTD